MSHPEEEAAAPQPVPRQAAAAPLAAVFYDGRTARRQPVLIAPSVDGLSLKIWFQDGSRPFLNWPFATLRALPDRSESAELVLVPHTAPATPGLVRLVVTDAGAVEWFRTRRPDLFRRDRPEGALRKVALWASAALGAVLLMLFVVLPRLSDRLAGWIAPETEQAMGEMVFRQIGSFMGRGRSEALICSTDKGDAALAQLAHRLTAGRDLGYPVRLSVMDSDTVNAFALPGGRIVILRGLLDEAKGPDEVAGVLAHEIGHLAARDPMRLMLRGVGSAGLLSMVLGDVTGGAFLSMAGDQLLQASYTRDAEASADAYGFDLLNDAAISSQGLADFFGRLAADTDRVPELASSHPLSAGRSERARANAQVAEARGVIFSAALDPAEWSALGSICAD